MAAGLLLCGCYPSAKRQLDEEKDPYFARGKSLVKQMDYKGAIEAFEHALETNPRSAAAHLELGMLYEERENDPAEAISHYRHFLKLRPESEHAEIVKQRIVSCIRDLAKAESTSPRLRNFEDEIQRLNAENNFLRQQIHILQAQSGRGTNGPIGLPPGPILSNNIPARIPTNPPPGPARSNTVSRPAPPAPQAPATRKHSVRKGETITRIAAQYHVSEASVLAANPGVRPRNLQPGQVLNIPGSSGR